MKIEQQVCDIKLAQKLKELKVKQDSVWYWENIQRKDFILSPKEKLMAIVDDDPENGGWTYLEQGLSEGNVFSAFTVAELGELLPESVIIDNQVYILEEVKYKENKRVIQLVSYVFLGEKIGKRQIQDSKLIFGKSVEDKIEANSRAKLAIYLIEKGLIKITKVKS